MNKFRVADWLEYNRDWIEPFVWFCLGLTFISIGIGNVWIGFAALIPVFFLVLLAGWCNNWGV